MYEHALAAAHRWATTLRNICAPQGVTFDRARIRCRLKWEIDADQEATAQIGPPDTWKYLFIISPSSN